MNKLSFDIFASWVKAHFNSDKGATMVEYALMVALIALVCVGAVKVLGSATDGSFTNSGSLLSDAGRP